MYSRKILTPVKAFLTKVEKLFSTKRTWKYASLSKTDQAEDAAEKVDWKRRGKWPFYQRCLVFLLLGSILTGLTGILIFVGAKYSHAKGSGTNQVTSINENPFQPAKSCQYPSVRHEWRTLSKGEQFEYIRAVKCLTHRPSRVRTNGTLYDDFPWIHATSGSFSHHAAAFLSWHRYFIQVFEDTLREDCGYQGTLVYWDWSLDWNNLTGAPVWDPETGFGGDGDMAGEITIGEGRCVTDGPFAGHINMFYGPKDHPHCLSRGFTDGEGHYGTIPGESVHPERIEDILSQEDYESFFFALEKGPHDTIPNGVRGDFFSFTAPYDPVFYLHHTQLDRLWWLWQERNPRERHFEYTGPASMGSDHMASVYDQLPMSGFVEPLRVTDIMNTESDFLCYRY
ncbi:Di-copper centre-containing protein [Aspergillus heteromorphus CBS 117.55]|uniref:Di-copper centre-containing protein n=1 Tax=Aspergillus heteromorphus CBS 117.55 TaxID=1448321 RepID=A0A317VMA5_9EURO|nr:Di-copper centre-containing protein [Aspergillus heteromorphus CBS 117.55]PWY74371.1 Di-copper centre-containing protein [Aspergillus heteromorphus CBS 117.55]